MIVLMNIERHGDYDYYDNDDDTDDDDYDDDDYNDYDDNDDDAHEEIDSNEDDNKLRWWAKGLKSFECYIHMKVSFPTKCGLNYFYVNNMLQLIPLWLLSYQQ